MPTHRRRRLLAALAPLVIATEAALSPLERLSRLSLPACAVEMMLNCSMERHEPLAEAVAHPPLPIEHAYVLHYKGNVRRKAYQLAQVPKLGVAFTLVLGYDRDEIDGHNRACMLSNSPRLDIELGGNKTLDMHALNPSYISQVVKLFAALYDMLSGGHATALILEDDAVVRFEHLPSLATALHSLGSNYTIVYSGSYNPKGTDGLPAGLYPKDAKHVPDYRGPGRMMPAVGCVLSVAGAAHVLDSLPIRAPVDMSLSDWRVPSAPRHRSFVFKPFAFTPGGFGASGIFGEGIEYDKQKAQKAAAGSAQTKSGHSGGAGHG